MRPLSIEKTADAAHGKLLRKGMMPEITGVSTDTRTIRPGDLFVPLIGERFDGHKFLPQAVQKGAAAVLTRNLRNPLPDGISIIYCEDTLASLQELAAWYLKSMHIPVVAVTGSTGKTSTRDMIACVLSEQYCVLSTHENFNNAIGLPLTLFRLEPCHQVAVLEMGMSGFGEIRRLAGIAPPKIAVLTNIGISHIEKLGSRENILKAKLEILEQFQADCTAVLNDDNDLLHQEGNRMEEKKVPFSLVRFGTGPGADYRAEDLRPAGESGMEYTLVADRTRFPVRLRVPGKHNVFNSLAAIAVGRTFGIGMDQICSGLLKHTGGQMRLHVENIGGDADMKIIDDVYNASPDSVHAAMELLRNMAGGRKIAVLGDMMELGDYSERAHRQVGEMVAEYGTDILITKGNYSSWIADGAKEAGMPAQSIYDFPENQGVIQWMKDGLSDGDRILIKGSRAMKMEEIVAYLKGGDFSG